MFSPLSVDVYFSRVTAALTEQRLCGFHFNTPDALLRSNAWFVAPVAD